VISQYIQKEQFTLPLTGFHCINKITTNLAVLQIENGAFHSIERISGVPTDEIQTKTAGKLVVRDDVPEMLF